MDLTKDYEQTRVNKEETIHLAWSPLNDPKICIDVLIEGQDSELEFHRRRRRRAKIKKLDKKLLFNLSI